MKMVNICIGRFQPFTNGHYKCVETAWKLKHLPTVICIINVPESKVDKRHPFPTSMLVDVYNDVFANDPKIADVVAVSSADIVAISKMLQQNGMQIASWTCGTDRFETYNRMSTKYHELANLSDDFELLEIPRSDDDVSATKARNCLLNDDMDGFFNMLPNMSDRSKLNLYDKLKQQIENVYNKFMERRIMRLERLLLK